MNRAIDLVISFYRARLENYGKVLIVLTMFFFCISCVANKYENQQTLMPKDNVPLTVSTSTIQPLLENTRREDVSNPRNEIVTPIITSTGSYISITKTGLILTKVEKTRIMSQTELIYEITYPSIPAQEEFNRYASQAIDEFISELNEKHQKSLETNRATSSIVTDLRIVEEINNQHYVGLVVDGGYLYWPAPYPINTLRSLNFDKDSRHPIKLEDLFMGNTNYLEKISIYCIEDLQRRKIIFGDLDRIAPRKENYTNWVLTRRGLKILFVEGQIGPHAVGQPSVTISFDDLKKILNFEKISKLMSD